jgi:hypothetical protein
MGALCVVGAGAEREAAARAVDGALDDALTSVLPANALSRADFETFAAALIFFI